MGILKTESPLKTSNKALAIWLFSLCGLIAIMVVFGGFVRLTRSGLSIVEWEVITGVIPPLSEAAWQSTFAQYQQTPEYRHINHLMTLAEYKSIYYAEYFHRLLGRVTGLILVIPLAIFLWRKIIPWREAPIYLGISLLFALQGAMGWYMVQSGLVNQPQVSHYRLTAHLLLAVALFTLCFWLALRKANLTLGLKPGFNHATVFNLSLALTGVIVIQIAYGGLMAGLKAGYISNTFPLMFGYLIPPGLLSPLQPWALNLVENPATVHFVHRWLAFIVLALTGVLYFALKKGVYHPKIQLAAIALVCLVSVQILLGIEVIFWHVPISLALVHQATALGLFALALFINYQLKQILAS
jgi:cytochrome c oxidase assembly protein subunit 15